uniref:Polyprotein n=1 Tax=Oryza sativa subsp. japonica TaxID=39947 RepID=Q851Y3_ORYSJ|nr:putative polyprotein [Oryza sativa Japonica Group]
MGENQGLEQVMGKLVEMLAKKFNEAPTTSSAVVPHTESVQKIELMQNDIKLEGVKNYLSWSRRALLILKTKGLEGYVTGEIKEPENISSVEWKTWSTTNSLVVAWLLTSLIPAIATTVETISSASEMWKTLTNLYSGEGNVMLMVEAQEKISVLRQGERSVAEYVAELKHLWSDLDHYDPLGLEHPDCIAKMRKWIERRRVIEFLKGLNSEFEGRRDAMFHQTTLPSLDEAIAAMAQEELKKKVLPSATPSSPSPTYVVAQSKETRECFNCGEMGHLIRDYRAPRKPSYGRGRFGDRGGARGGRGYAGRGNRGRGYEYRSDHRANVVTLEESCSGSTNVDVANLVHSSSGNSNQAFMSINSSHSNWILDSGASRHVTVNLVSISSLVDHMNCRVSLDRENCLIQERETGKKLGIGVRRDGLWYLDRKETSEDVCLALMAPTSEEEAKFIRTDNGGEYINNEFSSFLSSEGILHQTSCPDTPPQNGVAERKNRHLLETARSLMYAMNVPKFLWSEAVMTATYLINRTPSRILGMKTPCEMIFGKNEFVVPPKVFGCTCFVRDHRPSIGKLDPRAVKCIFVGYSSGQKGYKCWSPSERRTFVSMDVTFRESVPFYGEKTDLSSLFIDLDDSTSGHDGHQMKDEILGPKGDEQPKKEKLVVGSIPCPMGGPVAQEQEWRKPHEEKNLQVYTRRTRCPVIQQVEEDNQVEEDVSREQGSLESGGEEEEVREESDLPIAIRKSVRSNAGKPPLRYGFEAQDEGDDENNISNYVSYDSLSSTYKAFIASLDSVQIPKDWREAKQDPRWHQAMLDELEALEKNKTWDLVPFPKGKKIVNCKWVYTVKQNPDGKVERYKARLVAKGYSQTYGIDYDETFAPVAKMSTVRTLISCAANFDWPLHQLDVKNAFLHRDLQEEVYMDVPPGFATSQTKGKVLRLKKSLYGLKQSPRAWFDRFRRAMCAMDYKQCNGDHTVFYHHSGDHITILAVYVDDMIITGNDCLEITRLKRNLSKEFEVKDLGQLRYFLGIEIARSPRGIVISQRKYVLDLLSETGMLGCCPVSTPIDQNHKLCAESGDPVNRERYQRLVGRLIYLCHTRPDITYAVSMVSRYMHDPRSSHMEAVYRILRYLKGSPGKGLWFKKNGHLKIEGYCDADWASCLDDRRSTSGYCVYVGGNLVSWRSKKQSVVSRSTAEAEYRAMAASLSELLWLRNLLVELKILGNTPMKLLCDNKSAINIANNPVQHDRTKHVEIDRFFIKEKLDEGVLELGFVTSGGQVADCLTKGLGVKECNCSCDKMGMIDIYHPS